MAVWTTERESLFGCRWQHFYPIWTPFCNMFKVTFIPRIVTVCFPRAPNTLEGASLTLCPSRAAVGLLLMLSAIHDRQCERGVWWLKWLCSLVSLWPPVEFVFQKATLFFSFPFEAGDNNVPYLSAWWWLNSTALRWHIHNIWNRDNFAPARNILMYTWLLQLKKDTLNLPKSCKYI